jgi:hypothetical protein
MMIWNYLKAYLAPNASMKTHLSWRRWFPLQHIRPPNEKSVPVTPPHPMARWLLRGRRLMTRPVHRNPDQAPRAAFSRRATPHR